jgi:transcriptional regulator with XRE-family HTH domain
MSRRELVEATGLSYPYVSQLETGYRLPSSTALRDLAAALAISTDELVSVMPAERSGSSRTAPGTGHTSAESGWITNPTYARPSPAAPLPARRPRRAAVVEQAVDLLASLPPDQRLDALSKVQRALMAGLVDEGIRRTGRKE